MARLARRQSGTGIYHVMLRGINRQNIFEDEEDYLRLLGCLRALCIRHDDNGMPLPELCTIYAYCLMSNHVHLLIQEKEESIGETIKRLGDSYARYYNKKYYRNGHLFQDRFKSEPVNDNAYFFTLLQYIHQNPVAAGITTDVTSYQWSSWGEYERAGNGIQSVCSTKAVLSRVALDDLRALVNEPLPKTVMVLDYDNGSSIKTDDEMKEFFVSSYGLKNPMDLQLYSRDRRNDILRSAKEFGATIRQLVRLTGLSFGIIRNA
jgi:REP element-mobilizing transposase RayT